jgi:RecA/RadA recombinase
MTSDLAKALKNDKASPNSLLSSGSSLLNLCCSGRVNGAIPKGAYVLFAGRTDSGKTWLALQVLAEACASKQFADYEIHFDNAENGALMDIAHYFGKKLDERMKIDHKSVYLEEFYDHLDDIIKRKVPFVYVLDSMDALVSKAAQKQYDKEKAARKSGDKVSGDYGTAKAKINSTSLPRINAALQRSGSILIIISQARDNIGIGAQFNPDTRAGGRALSFYAQMELWFKPIGELKRTVRKKARQVGNISRIKVKRTRVTGRRRQIDLPIYHSFGVDDVGSCIDFLTEECHWTERDGKVDAKDFNFTGPKEKLIQKIEAEGLEKELRTLVASLWNEIEQACQIKRKRRYT